MSPTQQQTQLQSTKLVNTGDSQKFYLLYTAIDDSLNKNGWRVDSNSIADNIKSGLNKPIVLKLKDAGRPQDTAQKGRYIHPYADNPTSYQDQLDYQESYALGRAVDFDQDSKGVWRVWFEITDPAAVMKFKQGSQSLDSFPAFISPAIATYPFEYPDEDNAQVYKHWGITHWAFVDEPAYGVKMAVRGQCHDTLNRCAIKLKNASVSKECGFCVAGELTNIIAASNAANSSQVANSTNSNSMSEQTPLQNNTVNSTLTDANGNPLQLQLNKAPIQPNQTQIPTTTQTPSKQEAEPGSDQKPGQEKGDNRDFVNPQNQEEQNEALLKEASPALRSYIETLRAESRSKQTALETVMKQQQEIQKQLNQISLERRRFQLSNLIPRDIFKSDESYQKELDNVMTWQGISDDRIREIYQNQIIVKQARPVQKGASVYEVPNFGVENKSASTSAINSSDRLTKLLDLPSMLESGGATI